MFIFLPCVQVSLDRVASIVTSLLVASRAKIGLAMDTSTAVCKWIHYLGPEIPNGVLKGLELRLDGCSLQRMNRLHNWLMGNYSAEDFVVSHTGDTTENQERRFELRKSFIAQTILEKSRSSELNMTCNTEEAELHPFSLLDRDPLVMLNLTNTRWAQDNSRLDRGPKSQMNQNMN